MKYFFLNKRKKNSNFVSNHSYNQTYFTFGIGFAVKVRHMFFVDGVEFFYLNVNLYPSKHWISSQGKKVAVA